MQWTHTGILRSDRSRTLYDATQDVAVKWSFLGLAATALFQVLIVWLTWSVVLPADLALE